MSADCRRKRSRGWLFTINNPSSTEVPREWDKGRVRFCIWQLERGQLCGTPHLQGYCLFDTPTSLASVKVLDSGAHWEPRLGSHKQARDYCSKSDTRVEGPFQYGEEPAQGKRNDLDSLKEAVDAGSTEADLWEVNFSAMVKFNRGIREYKRLRSGVRTWKTEVTVLWGPTGTGKSKTALDQYPGAFWKRSTAGGTDWWDGYDCHEDVVIDEFYGWIRWDMLLRLLDRYPLTLDTKGGAVSFVARRIIITSNCHPSTWYNYDGKKQYATLERRLDKIGYIESLGMDPVFEEKQPLPGRVGPGGLRVVTAPNYFPPDDLAPNQSINSEKAEVQVIE